MTTNPTRVRGARWGAALAIGATVALSLTACSSGTAAGSGGSSSSKGALTIQFVNPLPSYPTWKQIGSCMKDEAQKRGAQFSESGPTGQAIDATAMIQQVQQAIANRKGAIITFPTSDGFTPVLKQAQGKGIVTGTIYGTGGPDSGSDYNIGPDWTYIGKTLVEAVSKEPGKHVLGLVAAADTGIGKSWLDGVKAAAAATDNVTIGGEVYTGDDSAKALSQVNALLTAHPDVTDIVSHMGTTTPGATAAIKAKGAEGRVHLVPVGQDNGGAQAVKDGAAQLMFLQDVCTLGKQLADGVVDVHDGKTPPQVPVKIAVVQGDQVQSYLDKGWV